MIPASVLSRLNPERERQTLSIGPAEYQALKKDDTAVTHYHRIVVVETTELRQSRSLSSYHATFTSVPE